MKYLPHTIIFIMFMLGTVLMIELIEIVFKLSLNLLNYMNDNPELSFIYLVVGIFGLYTYFRIWEEFRKNSGKNE